MTGQERLQEWLCDDQYRQVDSIRLIASRSHIEVGLVHHGAEGKKQRWACEDDTLETAIHGALDLAETQMEQRQ
jgi:hypothetical protein